MRFGVRGIEGHHLADNQVIEKQPDGLVRITLKKAYADGTVGF